MFNQNLLLLWLLTDNEDDEKTVVLSLHVFYDRNFVPLNSCPGERKFYVIESMPDELFEKLQSDKSAGRDGRNKKERYIYIHGSDTEKRALEIIEDEGYKICYVEAKYD